MQQFIYDLSRKCNVFSDDYHENAHILMLLYHENDNNLALICTCQ